MMVINTQPGGERITTYDLNIQEHEHYYKTLIIMEHRTTFFRSVLHQNTALAKVGVEYIPHSSLTNGQL